MKRTLPLLALGLLILFTLQHCSSSATQQVSGREQFAQLFNPDALPVQTFTIDPAKNETIKGEGGTKIVIPKGSLVDDAGNPAKGPVTISLTEALDQSDWVLGNLTTLFDNQPLESGGMINVTAQSEQGDLQVKNGKSISVSIPAGDFQKGMSFFEGERDSNGVQWKNPVALKEKRPGKKPKEQKAVQKGTTWYQYSYEVDGRTDSAYIPLELRKKVSEIAWLATGKNVRDSVFVIDDYVIKLFYSKIVEEEWDTITVVQGVNSYVSDQQTEYLFSMKNLGWANIDRLQQDPRTQQVELITDVTNQAEFDMVFVTLITSKMYLPGYQKMDETFCFSHGDYEAQNLPVGEPSHILATAFKDGVPYFAILPFTIEKTQSLALTLAASTKEQMKAAILEEI